MEPVDLTHAQLRTDFERFRVINPSSEARMIQSIKVHGQISPLLAGRFENERFWVLIDGFKRFRATQALKMERVRVWSIQGSMSALKAMVLTIHYEASPCKELEESLVLQSLHREDGLRQQEIALLCNRHKSWVSRRIALIERLSEEIVEQLRLGLLSMSTAWELMRLQRCNQNEIVEVIRKHRFSHRQSRLLIDTYMNKPAWQRKALLETPDSMIKGPPDPRTDCGVFTMAARGLRRECDKLILQMSECGTGSLRYEQRISLRNTLDHAINKCESCQKQLLTHNVEV